MRHHDDEWLQQKIDEDIIAMADKHERELKANPFYAALDLSEEKQQELRAKLLEEMERREADWENVLRDAPEEISVRETSADPAYTEHAARRRFRWRPVFAAAAVLVLCLGLSMVGTGSRVYVPEIFQRSSGDEETLKINNTEAIESQYDEEAVCVEIEEKIGAIPPRLMYKPKGMTLKNYSIRKDEADALLEYAYDDKNVYIFISKDWEESSISNHVDGEKIDKITIITCSIEVPIYVYRDLNNAEYYEASFEYLNTYYSFNGMINLDEFMKIIENTAIKNA